MPKSPRVRFTFRVQEGSNAGLGCGGWRVWTNGEDTYVTAKPLGDTWKVSLHGDQYWAMAVPKENTRREDTILPEGHDRAMWPFQPTPFVEGRRIAFAIAVFRHALRPEPVAAKEAVIGVPDRWDALFLALVRMTEAGVEPDPDWNVVGGPLPLASGRRVWVTSHFEEIATHDPEPVPATTMIEPVTPETHDVASPGWFVKGVHLAGQTS